MIGQIPFRLYYFIVRVELQVNRENSHVELYNMSSGSISITLVSTSDSHITGLDEPLSADLEWRVIAKALRNNLWAFVYPRCAGLE